MRSLPPYPAGAGPMSNVLQSTANVPLWIPHPNIADVANNSLGNLTSSSTTYVDLPTAPANDVTHGKNFPAGDTEILVTAEFSMWADSSITAVTFGVRVDTGTDYDVVEFSGTPANVHRPWSGERIITGLAAGSHTYRARVKFTSAFFANMKTNQDDYCHIQIEEIAA